MAEGPQPPSSVTAKKPQPYRNPSAPLRPPPHGKPPHPQTFRPPYAPTKHRRRSSPLRSLHLCRCCFLTLLLLLLLLAVAAALSYYYFQPKPPAIHLQSLKLSHFHVSITPSGTFLSAAAAATVHATNPNGKIVLSYDPGEVTVSAVDDDGDVGLGEERLVGWRQKGRNSTVVRVETRVEKVAVDDGVGARLMKGFSSKEMKVVVELTTRIGVGEGGSGGGGGGGGWLPVRIRCGEVSLRQMGGGGELPKCTFNLLRWINLN